MCLLNKFLLVLRVSPIAIDFANESTKGKHETNWSIQIDLIIHVKNSKNKIETKRRWEISSMEYDLKREREKKKIGKKKRKFQFQYQIQQRQQQVQICVYCISNWPVRCVSTNITNSWDKSNCVVMFWILFLWFFLAFICCLQIFCLVQACVFENTIILCGCSQRTRKKN